MKESKLLSERKSNLIQDLRQQKKILNQVQD